MHSSSDSHRKLGEARSWPRTFVEVDRPFVEDASASSREGKILGELSPRFFLSGQRQGSSSHREQRTGLRVGLGSAYGLKLEPNNRPEEAPDLEL